MVIRVILIFLEAFDVLDICFRYKFRYMFQIYSLETGYPACTVQKRKRKKRESRILCERLLSRTFSSILDKKKRKKRKISIYVR